MATEQKYKYGCLMLQVSVDKWEQYREFIGEENLYISEEDSSFGFEDKPHVTIMYGFNDDGTPEYLNRVDSFVQLLSGSIKIETSQISIFESTNGYDVVKFDIESFVLQRLNDHLKRTFEHTTDHPNYHPHMTIAYVKSGLGKNYIQALDKPLHFTSNTIIYSRPDKTLVEYKI
jgi:2'-5' RNA ligase